MSFFDRLLGRGKRFEDLRTPWGDRPAIYTALRAAALPDGSLPEDFELPDTPEPTGGIRWAPGALDGVMSHHVGQSDGSERAASIAEAIVNLTRKASDGGLKELHERVGEGAILDCVDELAAAISGTADLDADRLHDLGAFLATHAAEREMVKLGAALLGMVEGPDDRDVLLTLGACEELTLFAIVAILNRPDFSERDLWALAQRTRGWGRIQSVERLAGTSDPAIQRWMLREGFRNSVMNEYLAHQCATDGRLAQALDGEIDDALLAGAAGLLEALINGGPAADIRHYDDGAVAAERFLDHVAARAEAGLFDLDTVGGVASLARFVASDRDWRPLEAIGWTPAHREGLGKVAAAVLAHPEWEAAVEDALDSADQTDRWKGEHLAQLLELDTFERTAARLERDPVDHGAWFMLMRQLSSSERVDRAIAIAETLPLDTIASGPADELGLGPGYAAHQCLDVVAQHLDEHPGKGWPLLAASLRSPVIRNRNMALRALAAWSRADWPEEAEPALEAARAAEPDDDVRERIEAVLDGRPLD